MLCCRKQPEIVQQASLKRLTPGDIPGIIACIREDFDQRAYFITGDNPLCIEQLPLHASCNMNSR